MIEMKKIKEIMGNKRDFVRESEEQIRKVKLEGNRIEQEVIELTKRISYLL